MHEGTKREDRRVRRTKKLLTQALTKLMQEKKIKEITVKELTELADMNRGTFYLYYKDINNMVQQIEDGMFVMLEQLLARHEGMGLAAGITPILQDIFRFVYENSDLCRALLSPNGDITFLNRMNELLRKNCRTYWDTISAGKDEAKYEYYYSFCVSGCAGIIHAWLANSCREAPEQMAALACSMLRIDTIGENALKA